MIEIILMCMVISFASVVLVINPMIKFLRKAEIIGIDQQKSDKPRLPTSAGLIVMIGILSGIFTFIGIDSFILHANNNLSYILAGTLSILIITLVGFFDDIIINPIPKENKGVASYRVGLRQREKALLVLPAAIPLMAVKAGTTTMSLPLFGPINFGIIYPLIFIPLAVLCVANATNMLAGMNGLEAGLGLIATTALGIYGFIFHSIEAMLFAFVTAGALGALLFWNWYPAKILPGDSLTYLVGAAIVTTTVLGNMEKFGIIIFTPWLSLIHI